MKNTFKYLANLVVVFVIVLSTSLFIGARNTPSRGSSISSWSDLVASSPVAANFLIDRPRVWIPVAGGAELAVASLVGLGAGTPALAEINTSEIAGFTLDADDESVSAIFPLPSDIDTAKDVRVRVLWSNSEAAATGTAQFACTYKEIDEGTTALAEAATAFDTDAAAEADLAANVVQWGPWNTIDGGTLTGTPGDDMLVLKCAVDLTTAADATVYGFQLDYYREFFGAGSSY